MLALSSPACRREERQPPEADKAAPSPAPPAPATEPPAPPTPEPQPTLVEEPRASGENLQLIGIVRGAGGSSAVIELEGKQEIFRRGDAVFGRGTVKEVRDDSVVIHSGSKDVTLKLAREEARVEPRPPPPEEKLVPPAPSELPPVPISTPLSRAETRSALKDFSAILAKADARRVAVGDGHGLELVNTAASSFLAKLGLRSGDILEKLNGIVIDDPEHLPDLSSAADGKELSVSFWRNDIGLTVSRRLE